MKIEKSKEKGIKESGQSTLGHIIFKDPRLKNAFKERLKARVGVSSFESAVFDVTPNFNCQG